MAAILNIVDLRRHALPTDFMVTLVRETGVPRPSYGDGARPRLLARWHISYQGRPVCAWSAGAHEGDTPPG